MLRLPDYHLLHHLPPPGLTGVLPSGAGAAEERQAHGQWRVAAVAGLGHTTGVDAGNQSEGHDLSGCFFNEFCVFFKFWVVVHFMKLYDDVLILVAFNGFLAELDGFQAVYGGVLMCCMIST